MGMEAGDIVSVLVDPDVFKLSQEDQGGWNNEMAMVSPACVLTTLAVPLNLSLSLSLPPVHWKGGRGFGCQ